MSTAVKPIASDQAAADAQSWRRAQKKSVRRDNLAGYLFIAPWLIGFIGFTLLPMIASFVLSFTDYSLIAAPHFVGLENYQKMFFEDPRYWKAMRATFFYVFSAIPLRLAFALGLAMLLNNGRRGISFYRAGFYVPSIIGASVAVAIMWRQFFGSDGIVNAVLWLFGIPPTSWIGNPNTAIWTLILLAVWQFGSPMLIFLAGLKHIPQELYESASIDGAGGWSKFISITIPMLSPVILFNLVLQLISGFLVFTQAFLITEGGPLDTTLFYALYLFQRAFVTFQMGYSSAMAWVLLVIIAIFTAITFRISNSWVFYEEKRD